MGEPIGLYLLKILNAYINNISSRDKEIKVYNGLKHEILNEKVKDQVIDCKHAWIENRLT
jgi:lysophospholipase